MKLVEVVWKDCYSHCERPWYTREELDKASTGNVPIFTVGYVFKDDGENITLTMSHNAESPDSNEVGMGITIPLAMVVSIRELEARVGFAG